MKSLSLILAALTVSGVCTAKTIVEALTEGGASELIKLVSSTKPILDALTTFKQPLTLFAPTNHAITDHLPEGFDASNLTALASVLQYHVVPGAAFAPTAAGTNFFKTLQGDAVKVVVAANQSVTVNTGSVTRSITFDTPSQGIVHFIDTVLIPPEDLVSTAVEAGLSNLVQAATTAELVPTLSALANFTVFAPTNKAFEDISSVASGLSKEKLASILTLHVVSGTIAYSTDVVKAGKLASVATANGQTLDVVFNGTNVVIVGPKNNATVVAADVLVRGGVVHVIDAVLLPNDGAAGGKETGAATGKETKSGTIGRSVGGLVYLAVVAALLV